MRHLLPTLIARDFSRRRTLLAFTLLAIVATSCLTVWFVASIDLNAFADDNGKQDFFGRYTLAIAGTRQLPYDVTDCIPDLPDVVRTSFARQTTATVYLKGFAEAEVPSGMGDRRSPMLLGMTDQISPFPLAEGRWFEKPGECVVGTAAADIITADASRKATSRRLHLGDVLRVPTPVGDVELTVVGLVRQQARPSLTRQQGSATFGWGFGTPMATRAAQPQNSGKAAAGAPPAGQRPPRGLFGRGAQVTPTAPSIYLSMGDVTRCASQPGDANILFVELKDPTRVRDFYRQLEEAAGGPLDAFGVRAIDTLPPAPGDLAAFAEDGGEARVIRQAWSTVGLVILASVFIVFTTMSLAVSGRTRDLALLRTIGLTRRQVAAYILLEGLLLGVLGWAGGVLSGWLLLTLLLYWQAGVVPLVTLSPQSLLFALACSTLGALAASLIPAWRATRVSPAETLPVTALQRLPPRRLRRWGILGLLSLALIPILTFLVPLPIPVRLTLFSLVGTLLLGLALLLLAPWCAVLTERLAIPPLAWLLRLSPTFLSQFLTGHQRRTAATVIAMSIGLGLFTAVSVWSCSMLTMFRVPDAIPDVLVRFHEQTAGPEATRAVAAFPHLRPGHLMPVTVAQPETTPELARRLTTRGSMAANVVCMGLDPDLAWRERDPLVRLRFLQGSPQEAREAFAKPDARVCVIPETLAVNGDLKLGDTLQLRLTTGSRRPTPPPRGRPGMQPPPAADDDAPPQYVGYRVVGIVDFPWVWMSKCSGVRVSASRTSALIFTPPQPLIGDFKALAHEFFWLDCLPGTSFRQIEDAMRASAADIMGQLREHQPRLRPASSFSGGTLWDSGLNNHFVQVSSNESLNNSLDFRAYGVIDTMSRMPLVILVLSSLALLNTMVVSVRSRRWELGVLRACGVTRGGLVRMILAESLLVGLCACLLSLAFGVYYAWLATRLVDLAPMFGIIAPPLDLPWLRLLPGYALALLIALAAGAIPAVLIGRQDIARLLSTNKDA